MAGVEVLGAISAVISILDASKKIWDSARKDIDLPKTFKEVALRLPLLRDIIQKCHDDLKPLCDKMPEGVADTLEKLMEATRLEAQALRDIFVETIPGENDKRLERYKKAAHRLGKGKTVEQLMRSISVRAKELANYHAVRSASPGLTEKLRHLIEDLDSLEPSIADDQTSGNVFNASGNARQFNHTGKGQQFNYESMSGKQVFNLADFQNAESP